MEDDIKALSNHETFARFIQSIEAAREEAIGDIGAASTEHIQQLAGRIVAYDDILKMVNWEALRMRHQRITCLVCYYKFIAIIQRIRMDK
jgi:hypothetical protein